LVGLGTPPAASVPRSFEEQLVSVHWRILVLASLVLMYAASLTSLFWAQWHHAWQNGIFINAKNLPTSLLTWLGGLLFVVHCRHRTKQRLPQSLTFVFDL
jgi:hypothetical protein